MPILVGLVSVTTAAQSLSARPPSPTLHPPQGGKELAAKDRRVAHGGLFSFGRHIPLAPPVKAQRNGPSRCSCTYPTLTHHAGLSGRVS